MSRDNYGTGSLQLRGEVWHYDLMIEGERKRGSTGKKKKSEAQLFLKSLIGKRHRGELEHAIKSLTVGDVLDFYIRQRSSLKSIETYKAHSEIRLKPYLGSIPAHKLTTQDVIAYREMRSTQLAQTNKNCEKASHVRVQSPNYKEGRRVSASTINREVGTLRAAFREMQKCSPDSVRHVPYFPMESEKSKIRKGFVSEDDLRDRLLPNLASHLRPLVVCAFFCGGRTGEWLNLDWNEVDLEHGVIYFLDTKSNAPREIPIFNGLMRETLLRHKAIHDALWPGLEAVFTFDGTTRLKVFKRSWKTAMVKAGFPNLTPHDLRRSASRWMRNKGITRDVRKKILGHKTNSMDERYSIVDKADLEEAKRLGNQ